MDFPTTQNNQKENNYYVSQFSPKSIQQQKQNSKNKIKSNNQSASQIKNNNIIIINNNNSSNINSKQGSIQNIDAYNNNNDLELSIDNQIKNQHEQSSQQQQCQTPLKKVDLQEDFNDDSTEMQQKQNNNNGLEQQQQSDVNPFLDSEASTLQTMVKVIQIAFPNVLSFGSLWILNFSNLKVTEIFQEEDYISAYAMSFMWANALGFALILCLNNGLCAMSSQAIGFKKFDLVSIYYQRSQVLNFIFMFVMTLVMFRTESIFTVFTTPRVASLSQEFMYGYIPSLYFYIIFDSTRNIFNANQKFQIPNYMLMFTYVIHGVWVYLFMRVFNWKMFGLGFSRSVTEFLNAVILLVIVKLKGYFKEISFSWSKKAFKDWGSYLKLAIPMGSILYLDWVASDIQTIFVASIKNQAQFAGHSAFVSIFLLFVVFPLGLSITIMSYIGGAIGTGDVAQCKRIAKIGFISAVTLSILNTIITFFLEDIMADFFTNTPGEYKYFKVCYRIYNYVTLHANSVTMTMGSILRACGQQNAAFAAPLIFQFILGLPLQYYLVFTLQWGVAGSWIAYTISVFCTGIFFTYKVYQINWNQQIAHVQDVINQQMLLVFGQEEIDQLKQKRPNRLRKYSSQLKISMTQIP